MEPRTKTTSQNVASGCTPSGSKPLVFTDPVQMPWVVNSQLSYGYAAAKIQGSTQKQWCCACYELTFTSGPVKGKKMIVQATNTGEDLGTNHFDIMIPGGGVGYYNGCQKQFNAPPDGWGERYGGVSSEKECSTLPTRLQPGCRWQFRWFQNADNPSVSFKQVSCPAKIVQKSGCSV